MKFKKILVPLLVTLAVIGGTIGIVYGATSTVDGTKYTHPSWYTSSSYKLFHGIDVSYWQYTNDWTKIKKDGVDFTFIRCGYSTSATSKTYSDSYCAKNIVNAEAAGVNVGLYYFSRAKTTTQAVKEAKYAVSIANKYGGVTMPIVMDYETNCGSKATMSKCAKAFCNYVKSAGYTPMFYSYYSLSNSKFDFNSLSSYKFWLAHYSKSTDFSHPYEYWQYTSSGSVSGTGSKRVDRNFWYYKLNSGVTTSGTTSIGDCSISLEYSRKMYDGSIMEPAVTVKDGDTVLTKGTDYVTMYFHNVKGGTAYIIVRGIGKYSNETLKTFTIATKPINSTTTTVSSISNRSYTGSTINPSPTVKYNGTTLKKNTNYTLSYSSNKNVGTATVKIKGKGLYLGTVTKTFKIVKSKPTIKTLRSTYKIGRDHYGIKIGATTNGGKLTYSSSDESLVEVNSSGVLTTKDRSGTATITIKGAASSNRTAGSKQVTVKVYARPPVVTVTKIKKPAKNYFRIYWDKTSRASGYLIKYSNSSTFKTSKYYNVTDSSTTAKTIKDSLKGHYVYVKIKAYRTLDGANYYGSGYSKTLKIKVR
ncbi:GH25 family lysozyme [Aminicella lysinilytica]|uniref:GH25 family lysozyme n=1 Tax=Aminicella lysinilytica TaxID=433323 RepID=UPI0026EB1BE4|nr:GH25 family lysozyme [Aminicella lysinilytica]